MADTVDDAKRQAEEAAADDVVGRLAGLLGGEATAKAVFGPPVERDGVTVIPLARVRIGASRGPGLLGRRPPVAAGAQSAPVGFIEIREGEAVYRRIHDPRRLLFAVALMPLAGAAAFAIMAVTGVAAARSLRRMVHVPRPPWALVRRTD
ncbi:MAG: sporulation protein [Thermoleophilia bacterium]